MKKAIKLFLKLSLITITSQGFAQALSLGTDENTVYNTLYDMVNSYNRSQNTYNFRHFEAIRYNGTVREIIVSMNDLYFYDLRLTSDCAMHYVIRDGVLHHIVNQYGSLSTDQLTIGFNRIYGDHHLENYYFSDDY